MIDYVIASLLAIIMGQLVSHLTNRLSEIIEDEDAIKKLIPALKKKFEVDYIYSIVLLVIFNTISYFVSGIAAYLYMMTIAILAIVFVIDYKKQLIPDTAQVLLLVIGIVNFCINNSNWLDYILGGLIGGAIFLTLGLLAKVIYKKEGMGFGDVKLMACIGFIFGVKTILVIAIISFFVAAIVSLVLIALRKKKMDSYIPFGPFIVIGTLAVMLFGPEIYIDIYYNFCSALGTAMLDLVYKIVK